MNLLRNLPTLASSPSAPSTPTSSQTTTAQLQLPIPEEILEHILDILFPSSSAVLSTTISLPHPVLLVSRAFNRIGTPLLYRALYLNNPRRANALATTLRNRPDLALCVKAVRVESPLVGAAFDQVVDVLRRCRDHGGVRESRTLNYLDVSLDALRIIPTARARTTTQTSRSSSRAPPPPLPDATVPSDEDVRLFCRALVRVPDVRKLVVRRSGYATMRPTIDATCALTEGIKRWMSLEYTHLRFKPGPLPIAPSAQAPRQTAAPKSPTAAKSQYKYPVPLNLSLSAASASYYPAPASPTTPTSPGATHPLALAHALCSAPHLRVLRAHTPTVWSDFFADIAANASLERVELVDAGEDAALDRARETSGVYSGIASPVGGSFAGHGRGRGMSEGPSSMPGAGSLSPHMGHLGASAAPAATPHSLFGAQVAKHPRLQMLVCAGRRSVLAAQFPVEGGMMQAPGMCYTSSAPAAMGGSSSRLSLPQPPRISYTPAASHARTPSSPRSPRSPTQTSSKCPCPNTGLSIHQHYEHEHDQLYAHQYRSRAYTNPNLSHGNGRGHGQGSSAGLVKVGRS